MTKDKTVTMSRELAEHMRQRLIELGQISDFGPELFQLLNCSAPVVEPQCSEVNPQCSELLRTQAPVVERQEAPFYISAADWNTLVRDDVEIASIRTSRTKRSVFTEPLYASPPTPVAVVDPCDWSDGQILDFLGVALRNVDLSGEVKLSEIRQGFEYVRQNACLDKVKELNQ